MVYGHCVGTFPPREKKIIEKSSFAVFLVCFQMLLSAICFSFFLLCLFVRVFFAGVSVCVFSLLGCC